MITDSSGVDQIKPTAGDTKTKYVNNIGFIEKTTASITVSNIAAATTLVNIGVANSKTGSFGYSDVQIRDLSSRYIMGPVNQGVNGLLQNGTEGVATVSLSVSDSVNFTMSPDTSWTLNSGQITRQWFYPSEF